jgi:lysozyme family protein
MTTEDALTDLIAREGGYVDDPLDAGGPTKFGITQATLSNWRGHQVTRDEIKALSVAEAKEIYKHRFLGDTGYSQIDDEWLRAMMLDAAANHGPQNATKMLQKALWVDPDGIFGSITLAAVNNAAPRKLWLQIFAARLSFYGRIVTNDPSQAKFAYGWMNRMGGILKGFPV